LALSISPSLRGDVFDLPIGHGGEPGEDVAQVRVRIDVATAAGFDEGVGNHVSLSIFNCLLCQKIGERSHVVGFNALLKAFFVSGMRSTPYDR